MPLAVAVVAAASAGALVVRAAPFAGVVVLAVVVFAYLAQMARRPIGEVLLVAMIGLAGIVDILQKVDAGAASGQAVETVAMVWLGFLVCLSGISIPEGAAGRALGLLTLFVAFTVVSYSWGTISTQASRTCSCTSPCLLFDGDRGDGHPLTARGSCTRSFRRRGGWRDRSASACTP